jgi:hypothetical protein
MELIRAEMERSVSVVDVGRDTQGRRFAAKRCGCLREVSDHNPILCSLPGRMSNAPWTPEENDLIVADYFAMLAEDMVGCAYN